MHNKLPAPTNYPDPMEAIAGILEPDDIDFARYLADTDTAEKVRPAADYIDQVMQELAPEQAGQRGPCLPFANCRVHCAPGEVTLWGGYNASGKSALLGFVATRFAQEGEAVCIASLEMKPRKTLARINRQVFGCVAPSREQVREFLGSMRGRMWLYDQQGSVQPRRLAAVIRHCAERLQVRHFVLDNLTACLDTDEDLNPQKALMLELCRAARDLNIHIHVVVHFRKGQSEEARPSRLDIKGSGAQVDLVDQVMLVWRNRHKERLMKAGDPSARHEGDTLLICDKNRNGDWEGAVPLWYERETFRFFDRPVAAPAARDC